MQDVLAGSNGIRVVEVTVGGEIVRDIEEPIEPVPGADIHLTIDYRLQMAARAALSEQLRYWNEFWMRERGEVMSTTGTVMGMNPKTGELLFLVSYPNYENNRMTQFIPGDYYEQLSIDEAKPLVNKAISSELPPGSVFKMVPALGVLNEGIVTPEQTINCTPTITLRQQFYESDIGTEQSYYCHDKAGHGAVDYKHGIGYSCNIYWYKTSGGYPGEVEDGGLGIWNISEYGAALGYGKITGIELPGEADGLLPNPTWKRLNQGENWATGDTYLAGVGQGYVLATPVQVLNAFSTIVNGGQHMQLSMIGKTVDTDGNVVQSFEPKVLWDITKDPLIHTYEGNNQTSEVKTVEPWVIDLAMEGMQLVTSQEGTAKIEFEGDENKIAGKTGTAEYCDDWANREGLCIPGSWPSHAWFAGYAPYDDPEIVVVSFIYNGREGSTVSGPIVRKIIDAYFEFKAIDAELEGLQTGD
jgi:penicillin-binding protein 2